MPLDAALLPPWLVPSDDRPGFIDVLCTPAEAATIFRDIETARGRSMTGRVLDRVRNGWSADHKPSDEHWGALWAIAETLVSMAEGTCPAKVHLSPCDPGIGKSQTVIRFAEELVASPEHADVGMIVSVFTIAEAAAMARELAGVRDHLCVLTSQEDVNMLGGALADQAQILLTTQSRLGRLTIDRPFRSVAAFHYHGQPRAVRVWDESLLPGKTVVIGADAITGLASRIRRLSPDLQDGLYIFAGHLRGLSDGAAVDVPDFEVTYGVSTETLMAFLTPPNGTVERSLDRQTAAALAGLQGRRVRVRVDGHFGSAMLTYTEELAPDLPPMLVLDASGRVRETYRLWEEKRGGLVMLPAAIRDYSPLIVKLWRTSGSKSGWEKNGDRLVEGIAATIQTKPDERWLVVAHKAASPVLDLAKDLRAKLPAGWMDSVEGEEPRVSMTTWGQHVGLNRWGDVPNVILAGTLFYPDSHVTALYHLAAAEPVEHGLAGRVEVEQTHRGEHRNLILQAACRGHARRSDGARCGRMTLYVVASPRSGIRAEIPTIFPGCTVEAWKPLAEPPTGKLADAIGELEAAFEEGRTEISYAELYAAIGMAKGNFSARVANTPAWKEAVSGLDAEIVRGSRGRFYVRLVV